MEDSSSSIIETREELMISPTTSKVKTLSHRTAHFIRPSIESINGPVFNLPSHRQHLDTKLYTSNVNFIGWPLPTEKWRNWVDKMTSIHSSTWKKAGIFEAILSSKCEIVKANDLVCKLVEKWCPETSSFILRWGEATITLEDMLAIGFSVLGLPVFSPLETEEMKATEARLESSRLMISRSKKGRVETSSWMEEFMDKEMDIEHEAFLVTWLSSYVLITSSSTRNRVTKLVLPVAVRLVKGIRVALGPAVLASIYKHLTLLRKRFLQLMNSDSTQNDRDVSIYIKSPFILVQVWAWERFEELRPLPHSINVGEPRLARWKGLKQDREKVALVLDSAKASFKWRPYVETIGSSVLPVVNAERPIWVMLKSGDNKKFMLLVKCWRASSLIGLECSENYYPHRVAMQFGFDQDLPGFAGPFGEIDEIAWRNYDKPIDGGKLYLPSRSSKGHVTLRYMKWWKQSMLRLEDEKKIVEQQRRSLMASRLEWKIKKKRTGTSSLMNSSKRMKEGSVTFFRSPAKQSESSQKNPMPVENSKDSLAVLGTSVQSSTACGCVYCDGPSNTGKKRKLHFRSLEEINNSPAPPGFLPKDGMVDAGNSTADEDRTTGSKSVASNEKHTDVRTEQGGEVENLSGKSKSQQAYPCRASESLDLNSSTVPTEKETTISVAAKIEGNDDNSSPMAHAGAVTVLEPPKESSVSKIPEGVDIIIIDDDNEEADQVLPSEAIKNRKSGDGTALDQLTNQPTSTDNCSDIYRLRTKRSFEDIKPVKAEISVFNGSVAHFSNAGKATNMIVHTNPRSDGCGSKKNDDPRHMVEAADSTADEDKTAIGKLITYHRKHADVNSKQREEVQNSSGKLKSRAYPCVAAEVSTVPTEQAIIVAVKEEGDNENSPSVVDARAATVPGPPNTSSGLKIPEDADIIIIDDDNEETDQVLPSKEKTKAGDGAALDQLMNHQPTNVANCVFINTMPSFEDVKPVKAEISPSNGIVEDAHLCNAECVTNAIPNASAPSGGCTTKKNDLSELKASLSECQKALERIGAILEERS